MSSRFPPRGYVARRVPPGRIAEQMLPFGEGGPERTPLSVSEFIESLNGILKGGIPDVWVAGGSPTCGAPGRAIFIFL